jgi:4-aminobutyrate aminotransferase-like enzyme
MFSQINRGVTVLTQADSKLAAIIAEQEAIFVGRQPRSAALAARAAGVLAGGVTSSWQITQPQPVWLSHGDGGKVYDVDGNAYVDLHGGYGAALAGYAHRIGRSEHCVPERHCGTPLHPLPRQPPGSVVI